jgi:stage V sporulation protein D (sporulation-specific penicillin-binding protein)
MSMGYELGVTALQIASAVGAIANEGKLVPPRLVAGLRDSAGNFVPSAPPEERQVVSRRAAVTVANMLEGVVVRGTGKSGAVPGYHIGGKTGTTKKLRPGGGYSENDYFASFAAFGPLREPRLAGLLVLDTPRGGVYYGGLTAAPALGRVFADAFAYLGVPPDDDPWVPIDEARAQREARSAKADAERSRRKRRESAEQAESEDVAIGPGQVPDLEGASLRAATAALVTRGCVVRPAGTGVVLRQKPPPGTPIEPGMTCALELGAPPASPVSVAATVPQKPAARKPGRPAAKTRVRARRAA